MNVSGDIINSALLCGDVNQNIIVSGSLNQNITAVKNKIIQNTLLNGKIGNDTFLGGEIKNTAEFSKKELYFSSRFEFPNIGEENRLYVASDEGAVYLFSAETLCYICAGRDYNRIETIVCDI